MFETIVLVWNTYENIGKGKKILKILKYSYNQVILNIKNPEVLLRVEKIYISNKKLKTDIATVYESIRKEIEVENPIFTKNSVLFTAKSSGMTFKIKIHTDINQINVSSLNYSFYPFRNQQRLKLLKEDFRGINTTVITKIDSIQRNELLICEIKIEKIKNNNKVEFLFDKCEIVAKENSLEIRKVENKEYENLLKAVLVQWYKLVS